MIELTSEQQAAWYKASLTPPRVIPNMPALKTDEPPMDGLRDQFAAAALSGLLSEGWADPAITAAAAYEYADAMLKARRR